MTYRPLADVWILARPKVPYYGAYPNGFLERARALLGVTIHDPVLHVCGGKVRDYPCRGVGVNDKTLDLDVALRPDFCQDAREPLPNCPNFQGLWWPAILADPPYTEADANEYACGAGAFPEASALLRNCLESVRVGGRVGILHYLWPRPPKEVDGYPIRPVALVAVTPGWGNRLRAYSVFEKAAPR